MVKQRPELTAIELARAAVAHATERKSALQARIAVAEAQSKAAGEAFDRAVMSAPAETPMSDHGAAAGLVQAAGATVTALRRGLVDIDADIAAANATLAAAVAEETEAQWRVVVDGHLDLSKRIDAHGAGLAALLAEWRESVARITQNWPPYRAMHTHESEQLRDIRVIAWTIPAELQNAIVQTGSPHTQSLEAKTRSTWSQTVRGGLT